MPHFPPGCKGKPAPESENFPLSPKLEGIALNHAVVQLPFFVRLAAKTALKFRVGAERSEERRVGKECL